jgi:hypothetical protein
MSRIHKLDALEIVDFRGNPTLEVIWRNRSSMGSFWRFDRQARSGRAARRRQEPAAARYAGRAA